MTTFVQNRMSELSGRLYIGGSYVSSTGDRAPVIDPATEETIGHFALASNDEVDAAVTAARVAQREWWRLSALERADALHRVADRLNEMAPIVGECLTREMSEVRSLARLAATWD